MSDVRCHDQINVLRLRYDYPGWGCVTDLLWAENLRLIWLTLQSPLSTQFEQSKVEFDHLAGFDASHPWPFSPNPAAFKPAMFPYIVPRRIELWPIEGDTELAQSGRAVKEVPLKATWILTIDHGAGTFQQVVSPLYQKAKTKCQEFSLQKARKPLTNRWVSMNLTARRPDHQATAARSKFIKSAGLPPGFVNLTRYWELTEVSGLPEELRWAIWCDRRQRRQCFGMQFFALV